MSGQFESNLDSGLIRRLKLCKNLPSPPAVATRIIELAEDADSSLSDVAEAVSIDPALATKILRMANSPLYARLKRTESLQDAVAMFGLNGTLTLAMSFSLLTRSSDDRGGGLGSEDYQHYWRCSLAGATACRALAVRLKLQAADDYFLAGLLQDIGVLALDRAVTGLYAGVRLSSVSHADLKAIEIEGGGADHAQVGAWLLTSWKLSDKLAQAVGGSHDPDRPGSTSADPDLTRAVAVSSVLADMWFAALGEDASTTAAEMASHYFGLEREEFADILEPITVELLQNAAMFELDLGDASIVRSLTEQAKEVLMLRNLTVMAEARELRGATKNLEVKARQLEEESRRDPMTGLYNRRHVDRVLLDAFGLANDEQGTVGVAYLDLDAFKRVNDLYGHATGDEVLKKTATVLVEQARRDDVVARYGGEEFVVVFPGGNAAALQSFAGRVLSSLRETRHRVPSGDEIIVTASVGLAVHGEAARFSGPQKLIDAADKALYEAKQGGRDKSVLSGQETLGAREVGD